MNFSYYYGTQAEQFSFIKIPRALLTDPMFSGLSLPSKVLYGVLLDRMSLSMKNGWFDKENKVFIIYQISEIQEDLGLSKRKAMESLSELEKFGLVEKKKRGFGLPSILYVKNFVIPKNCARGTETGTSVSEDKGPSEAKEGSSGREAPETDQSLMRSRGNQNDTSGYKRSDSRSVETGTPEVTKPTPLEVPKSTPLKSKTDKNYTYVSKNPTDPILSASNGRYDEKRSEEKKILCACETVVKDNIEYESLLLRYPMDRELVEGITELIVETVLCQGERILIAQNWFPLELVKSKFMKLRYPHVEYVIDCLKKNTTEVRNIKKYLLAALFNAPSTIDGYYKSAVNHDKYEAMM